MLLSQRLFRLITPLFAIIGYVVVLIQFHWHPEIKSILPSRWEIQFYSLLFISFIASLMLPFCRRRPVAAWSILIFLSIIMIVIGLPLGGYLAPKLTLFIILLIEIFEYLPLWSGIVFSAGLLVLVIHLQYSPVNAWGLVLTAASKEDVFSFAVYAGFAILFNVIIRYLRDNQSLVTEIKKNYQEANFHLAQVNMQLQEYAVTAGQQAVFEERKRAAREIHDTLAYTLTNLVMMLKAAKYLVKPDENELLTQIELTHKQANEGLNEVHRTLQALRPVQLGRDTGLSAIYHLVATFVKATQIEVSLNLGNAPLDFGEEVDLVIYRFVQEGITNALRHGRATQITVSFSSVGNQIHILIQDNGIGADDAHEGFGLTGMRERIEKLGGRLETSSSVGGGFKLLGLIPMKTGVAYGKD
jgi:Signal transduction histidine kinase